MSAQTNAPAHEAGGVNEEIPVLSRCVNPAGISFTAVWYYPTNAPSFGICSYCYNQYIKSTPHASNFGATWVDGNVGLTCSWNTPRVMSHLAADDWDAIYAFMVERTQIPACKGSEGHTGDDGSRWYGMVGEWEIQGFVICEACYQDLVAWNELKSYFATTPSIKSGEGTWTCDASVQLIKEGLCRAPTALNRWEDLHFAIKMRMEYPSCLEMKELQASSTHWYASKAVPDLVICTACYLDHFVLDHSDSWERTTLTEEQEQQRFDCGMQSVPIYTAWYGCKRISLIENTNEYDGFEGLARMILDSHPCNKDDMRNAAWYAPEDCTVESFAICRQCLIGFMVCPGFASEFKEVTFRSAGNWICELNPAASRCRKYVAKYEAAVKQNNFSIFSKYVSEYAGVPNCPRNEAWKNRKWYRNGQFTACELCYKEVLEGTSLASYLERVLIPNEARCQMYSPRMRGLWQQACESKDLNSFLVLARERMDAYLLLKIEKDRQLAEMIMRSRQQQTLMLASTINQGTDGIISSMGIDNGTRYGNSSMGFNWQTPEGAEGHRQFQEAMGMDVVQAGSGVAAVMPLIRRWALLE